VAGDVQRKVRVIFQPSGLRVGVLPGTDILAAARIAGLHLGGVCGGTGTCGKCRVVLVEGRRRRPVLACRHVPASTTTVEVGEDAYFGAAQILEEGVYVNVEPRPNARLMIEAGKTYLVHGEDGERVRLRSRPQRCLGVALDMGTTTLVASLFDLASGKRLAVNSAIDPQVAMGEDVISRIQIAVSDAKAAGELRSCLISGLDRVIATACREAGASPGQVFDICAVGNTFMHHSFQGLPLKSLAESPYSPAAVSAREMAATETGLGVNANGRAFLPPVIAGFLGSDAMAGALAAGLDRVEAPTLYLDLGTNGEILLAHDGNILGATSASGPAFEGAQIECGMRAAEGAIDTVRIYETEAAGSRQKGRKGRTKVAAGIMQQADVEITTIGGKPARGIAGSGLVDAAAALLDAGALDRRGGLSKNHPLVMAEERGPVVVLCHRPRKIFLSQADIRNLQLAKAAVAAGTRVLLEKAGMDIEELDRVLLAGAFGNYMDRRSALRIGLLPPVEEEQVLGLGNAASTGAGMMLVSMNERRRALELAKKIQYVELAGNERFRELFVDCLAFP
jgi:uncharacterized 2Fe-2S/4Fe-4S cluster protein (DUF4445 family)